MLLRGPRSRRLADPDVAVRESLRLPDRRTRLRLVDGIPRGAERLIAVGRASDHRDARLAKRDVPGTVDDRDAPDAEATLDLVGDLAKDGDGHRLEGLVAQRLDGATRVTRRLVLLAGRRCAGRRPRPAEEPDDTAVGGIGEGGGQLRQDRRLERVLA